MLVLRALLGFPAAEVAGCLGTTVASVNSALQRAHQTLDRRREPLSQQATLRALGETGRRQLVTAFVSAWERADVEGIVRRARRTVPARAVPLVESARLCA